jgi:hypothetical protein
LHRVHADEVLAGDFIDLLVYEKDRRYCRDQVRQVLQTGVAAESELRMLTKSGAAALDGPAAGSRFVTRAAPARLARFDE